jgi:hypothetical protein
MNPYEYQPPQRSRLSVGGAVVLGALLGLVAGAVNALFSFGMLFATDSCGTGASRGNARVCDGGVWAVVVALPWAGLVVGVAVGVVVGVARVRRGRTPWPGLLVGLGLYGVLLTVSLVTVFG